jgi:hypothetical protein
MKKTIYLMLSLLIGSAVTGNAQVTIGDSKSPEAFAILELVSKTGNLGGLRLPQLSNDDKITAFGADNSVLKAPDKASSAQGLQIFNTTSRCVETWNGDEWLSVCPHAGRVAKSIDNGVITWVKFMPYNLGADPTLTMREQLLFDSSIYNGYPASADNSTGEPDHLLHKFKPVYGSLYQWGRPSDGHEELWTNTATQNTAIPADQWNNTGSNKFVDDGSYISDWLDNDMGLEPKGSHLDRWGDGTGIATTTVKGANDPCPAGFRVPSKAELQGILEGIHRGDGPTAYGTNKWVWVTKNTNLPGDATGTDLARNEKPQTSGFLIYPPLRVSGNTAQTYSPVPALFLPAAGYRNMRTGRLENKNETGYGAYWSSTIENIQSYSLNFYNDDISTGGNGRANGFSVRCIEE